MGYLNELDDELLEELAYEYEEELLEVDVDKIISDLKNNISEYIYENPDDLIPEEPECNIDFGFDDKQVPDEIIEKLEPKDDILNFVGK
ncbi:MAG: hypothetical protein U0K80_06160 [Methanobrevibacter sp.]|nr:hypothetical protein [Methanobrevibacter sp.]